MGYPYIPIGLYPYMYLLIYVYISISYPVRHFTCFRFHLNHSIPSLKEEVSYLSLYLPLPNIEYTTSTIGNPDRFCAASVSTDRAIALLHKMSNSKKPSVYVSIVTGCISGGVECVAVWPMEYIKTQLQLQRKLPAGQVPVFNGIISGLAYTVRTTGFFSLYNGLGVTLVGSIPKAGGWICVTKYSFRSCLYSYLVLVSSHSCHLID